MKQEVTRRKFLYAAGAVGITALAGCTGGGDGGDGGNGGDGGSSNGGDGGSSNGGGGSSPDYGGWFDNVGNFDGTKDMTGKDKVTVTVGTKQGSGNFGFGPPAIKVSKGTTVVWKWNGKGGAHNVVANDGSYKSGSAVDKKGKTFEHTFNSTGISKYYCTPHKSLGMKGAVYVVE